MKNYKSDVPITDCRSRCLPSGLPLVQRLYLSHRFERSKNGVTGVPADYKPYLAPINNTPGTPNFGNNNVSVNLKNGTQVTTAFSPGPAGANAFSQTILQGPFNYLADISLYKEFQVTEKTRFRINMDAFNALNIQGRVNPNTTDGIQSLQTSYWTPRQIQLTARFTF